MRRQSDESPSACRTGAATSARAGVAALVCLLGFLLPAWALDSDAVGPPALETALPAPWAVSPLSGDLLLRDIPAGLGVEAIGPLPAPRRSEQDASLYRVSYQGRSVQLRGNVLDVGSRFTAGEEGPSGRGLEEAELLKQALGQRGLNLSADWKLTRALALSSAHDLRRRDGPLDEKRGLTSSDTSHSLLLSVGKSSSIKAGLAQHRESWDRWLGRPEEQRRERRVEFQTGFGREGASGLRLALASVDLMKGRETAQERTSEAHLDLAPSTRLRLHADYLCRKAGETPAVPGRTQTTQTVGAAFQLAPETQFSAGLKTGGSGDGNATQESSLAFAARVGGQASGGKLALEQKLTRTSQGQPAAYRKYGFAGGLGAGSGCTNLQLDLQETRGRGPEAQLARNSFVHLERAFGPRVRLALDRRETVKGTNAFPEAMLQTRLGVSAGLGPRTRVTAGLMTGERGASAALGQRLLALSQEWRSLRLRLEQSAAEDGGEQTSCLGYFIEAPTGDLPDWAKTISTAHQFADADQYLLRREPAGAPRPDMPFPGYRLWAGHRAGGKYAGNSYGLAHRRIIAGRWQLQLVYEERPLATDGAEKGLPMPLRRQLIEIGRPLPGGLNARCSFGAKTGLAACDQVQGAALGLWGKLGPNEQVEGEVSRDSGRWENADINRTSVSLLYSRRVNEEHHVEAKLGYAWGDNVADDRDRDLRLTLSYGKPI